MAHEARDSSGIEQNDKKRIMEDWSFWKGGDLSGSASGTVAFETASNLKVGETEFT
jgi:hypothetical protein